MTKIQRKFTEYRQLLSNAKSIEADQSYIRQYADHLGSLDKIEAAFNTNDTPQLKNLLDEESRYYGWSYLPNDYGEEVENSLLEFEKANY